MDRRQVFLGGACGSTTWRRAIAIPALEAAGVTYYDPQLGPGEWTPACEAAEMAAKDLAQVLLFVINGETRGVASVGEVAYLLGSRRPLALSVTDLEPGQVFEGRPLPARECDDLNRGRIFLRTMAQREGVPVFPDVAGAVQHAIELVCRRGIALNAERLRAILADVRFRNGDFVCRETSGGFLIQLRCDEVDVQTGKRENFLGRSWFVPENADESTIVRTAFKAVASWQEHEARESFTYRGAPIFGPHSDVRDLLRLFRNT